MDEIGVMFDVSEATVKRRLVRLEIAIRSGIESYKLRTLKFGRKGSTAGRKRKDKFFIDIPKDKLVELYIRDQKSTEEIRQYFKCSKSVINQRLKYFGIKRGEI